MYKRPRRARAGIDGVEGVWGGEETGVDGKIERSRFFGAVAVLALLALRIVLSLSPTPSTANHAANDESTNHFRTKLLILELSAVASGSPMVDMDDSDVTLEPDMVARRERPWLYASVWFAPPE